LLIQAVKAEELLEETDPLFSKLVTVQVTAIADVSPADENTVDALLEGQQDMVRRDAPSAHDPHDADVRRVLQPTDPSQVSSGVCSPGAQKAEDLGLEVVLRHGSFLGMVSLAVQAA